MLVRRGVVDSVLVKLRLNFDSSLVELHFFLIDFRSDLLEWFRRKIRYVGMLLA